MIVEIGMYIPHFKKKGFTTDMVGVKYFFLKVFCLWYGTYTYVVEVSIEK